MRNVLKLCIVLTAAVLLLAPCHCFAATKWFLPGIKSVMDGTTDLDGATIKAMPTSTEYTFTETDDQLSDITAVSGAECTSTGFARITLTTKALTQDNTNHWVKWTADPIVETAVNGDVLAAFVFYLDTGGLDSTRIPLLYVDFTDTTANGGNITVTQSSNGWAYIDNL